MTTTAARYVTVDGVRLDTLAWNIEAISRAVSSRRSGDFTVPNLDGSIPTLNDALEPTTYGLQMWLRGTDVDGVTPGVGSITTLRNNLDELLHLFGKRHALLEVREQVDAGGTERRAWAKVTDTIEPDLGGAGNSGRFMVGMVLPYGVWEDVNTTDLTLAAPVTAAEVTSLQGATERVNDAIFLVEGPATTPRITDPATGMYVELGVALTAGQFWRFNSATWASRYGAGLSLGSADTAGTDGTAVTATGGPSRAYGLPVVPIRDTALRRARLTLTAASGIVNGTTKLSTRTRRKYAA
jgi:hypothetical protein